MKEIPIITEYLQHTKHIKDFDPTDNMDNLLPVIDIVPGWQQDISHCRSYDELPDNEKRLKNCLITRYNLSQSVRNEINT